MDVEGTVIGDRTILGDTYQMLVRTNAGDLLVVNCYGERLSVVSVEESITEQTWDKYGEACYEDDRPYVQSPLA